MHTAYLDMFRLLLAQGKTHIEARREFDRQQIGRAMIENLDTPEGRELLDLLAIAGMEEADERDREQCFDLWGAGWTHEKVTPNSRPMSWYWRSPPKGKRLLGKRYLSTNQAWMALQRSGNATPPPAKEGRTQ